MHTCDDAVRLQGVRDEHPASIIPGSEVIGRYHDLWRVEQSFRMSKTDLRARRSFHRPREAIEAHLTMVYTALTVARFMQDATGVSLKNMIYRVASAVGVHGACGWSGHHV